jgi:hypothetical protein
MDAALRSAHEAQWLDPRNPRMYSRIASLLLARQKGDEAAVVLMQGMLITLDLGLRSELVRLYGTSTDPANCTLVSEANGPEIDLRCPIVLDHVCAAAPNVLAALVHMGEQQEAMKDKQTFETDYRCAPGPLNQALPD